ncbi:MAG TPA: type II toxin-antitoxin system prevent-host-death family antitoxin [Polyangiaceae bacterium]|jgi:prevent-host-death family protein
MSKRTMTAARFRAECLQVLDTVATAGTEVVVTKRGKPVARIVPIGEPPAVRYGALRRITTIVSARDDLLSVEENWSVE